MYGPRLALSFTLLAILDLGIMARQVLNELNNQFMLVDVNNC